ncbi:dipeptidase PepV [Fictibacillus phosphorivorans]|uniref:dipeptidase PepV n=1 Tax=Fictibacillus phosphorivorans TaxID=1221500 RepID=UPI00203CF1AA|nr:dipeptidase PepV [Fictibacillus phosphorivorans]MCM3717999.1 dipeptidase PepV [Fictibacillus phosphorivorans]MCM3775448.1 dipeptidase PepV [Fictibacillus phosphorivorans]
MINWTNEVEIRKENLIEDTKGLLRIKSILDETKGTQGAPFGPEIHKALTYLLDLGSEAGMTAKDIDGYSGHLEMGSGEALVGILCHVDVVPAGEGWSVDPFGAEIKDGKIYARGAMDDKGPTMAAFYAMKIIQELNLPLSNRVRMIIGCDEESNWQCVKHYFQTEEMPDFGFAPDADFPIINAEKGIFDVEFSLKNANDENRNSLQLVLFESGQRLNMVPDRAIAKIKGSDLENIEKAFAEYVEKKGIPYHSFIQGGELTLKTEGKSAHGSTPDVGINAGLELAIFLNELPFEGQGRAFLSLLEKVTGEHTGNKLEIAAEDEASGQLTVNVGVMKYNSEGGKVGMNIRYPVTHDSEKIEKTLFKKAEEDNWDLRIIENNPPNYVDDQHPLIKTLQNVYEEQTGEKGELIAIGGGTYARSLNTGVAFGALFPGREDVAHQKDEYMYIEDLLKATAIYAQAIYELAK